LNRSARWVSDSANVPRLGLRPNLLLYFAASDTQRTLLVGVGSLGCTESQSHFGHVVMGCLAERNQGGESGRRPLSGDIRGAGHPVATCLPRKSPTV